MSPRTVENRILRFESIEGIAREDLPIALEIWTNDVASSSWVTREILKLANRFSIYISNPNPAVLSFSALEGEAGLDRAVLNESLRTLKMFGAVQAYEIDNYRFRAWLHLTYLQRLKVLEARARFAELTLSSFSDRMPWHVSDPDGDENGEDAASDEGADPREPRVKQALSQLAEHLMAEAAGAK
jgi:hypothetical protein